MPIIQSFGGIIPRTPDHVLPEVSATRAVNVKLRNSRIEAWRERLPLGGTVPDALTIAMHGCCTFSWDTCVQMTPYLPDFDRIYLTGRSDKPEVATLINCAPQYQYLGVPTPVSAPRVAGTQNDGRDCSARTYVYTYVNNFGEESAPSPPSSQITVRDGTVVTVSRMVMPPTGYGITHIKVYRTATAFRDGSEKEQQGLTDFLYVGVIALPSTSFSDNVLERNNGHALETREVRVPPESLRQIRHITGTTVLTGVTNNQVHFSQMLEPYNWPSEFDLTLPHNIVNMVTVDQYVMVSTDSNPYVINGGPSCEARVCRAVTEGDIPLPDIACGYPNSAIATPFGMVYSSKDGLVLLTPQAAISIITSEWFSTEDWIKLRPDTVRLAFWRGYLICVTDVFAFMLEIDGTTYSDFQLGRLTEITDRPVDMIVSNSGELMMLEDDIMYQWNAGTTKRPYIWESRELTFNGDSSPTTCKVRSEPTTFRLLTPHQDLFYERFVINERPFRLGRVGRHYYYRLGFYGTGTVEFVDLGMTMNHVNFGR